MAATLTESINPITTTNTIYNPKPPSRVCFSYAAYAKTVINHLKSLGINIENGLSDEEFSFIETKLAFKFPPDLRSILQEGHPVGPGFPNWRSSTQQLEILKNLPVIGLCRAVRNRGFWAGPWGARPADSDRAVELATGFLKNAPALVPIYQDFYIPARPCLAGNPILYVHGDVIRVWSYDISWFFQQFDNEAPSTHLVNTNNEVVVLRRPSLLNLLNAPPWAATEARTVEFWTEAAHDGGTHHRHRRWWSEDLEGYLEEAFLRLIGAGWKEEDVREMMMVDGGGDDGGRRRSDGGTCVDVESHVRFLSRRLLRAGWSTEDVVDSLGSQEDEIQQSGVEEESSCCIDFYDKKD